MDISHEYLYTFITIPICLYNNISLSSYYNDKYFGKNL